MKIKLPTKYDFIIALVICGLILIIGKSFDFDGYSNNIANGKEYFKPNLHRINKGVITNKYIDTENHSNLTIELITNDSSEYYYTLRNLDLYNYIQTNDSILKTQFGKEIIIRRNNTDSIFELNIEKY